MREVRAPLATRPGSRSPPGATLTADGANFAIFSRHATRIELLLYESGDAPCSFQMFTLDPALNHMHMMWHVFVEAPGCGAYYVRRMDGPSDTE